MAEKLFRDADDLEAQHLPALPGASPGKSTLSSKLMRRAAAVRNDDRASAHAEDTHAFTAGDDSNREALFLIAHGATHPVMRHVASRFDADARAPRDDQGVSGDATEHVARAEATSGQALPDNLRQSFESTLGRDLSAVRVHTGSESAAAADSVSATAYAVGNSIHFADGAYDPGSTAGQRLIAHEVVHTVQQAGAPSRAQYKLEVSTPGDALEEEADRLADVMVEARDPDQDASDDEERTTERRDPEVTPGEDTVQRVARPTVTTAPVVFTGSAMIHRYNSRHKHGFRRSADVPWCLDNPSDPWNGGAMDYVAASPNFGAATDQPSDIPSIKCHGFPEPLNGLRRDGKPYDLPPGRTVDKANAAIDALQSECSSVNSTYNTTAKQVRDYASAAEQVDDGGMFGPAPSGLNWNKPADGKPASVSELAEQQKVDGGKTSVGDLFNGGNDAQGISDKTIDQAKTDGAVSDALVKARTEGDEGVKTAIVGYGNFINETIGNAARKVADAYGALAMSEEEKKEEGAKEKLASLENEKKEAIAIVSGANTLITKAGKVLAGDVDTVREGIVFLADKVISAQYESEINAQKSAIASAKSKIRSLKAAQVDRAIESALATLTARVAELPQKRNAVTAALKKRQDLYDAAGKLAGEKAKAKGASKEEADRLRTAIAAIPRIEAVLGRIGGVLGAASVPTYNASAGLAYAVSVKTGKGVDVATLQMALGLTKTYRVRFEAERTTWDDRLKSVKTIAQGLNVPGR